MKLVIICIYFVSLLTKGWSQEFPYAEIDTSYRIWDVQPHNAFTSLVDYNNSFYCAFRSAPIHMWDSTSSIIILSSNDGFNWIHQAEISSSILGQEDIRDPDLSVTPDGRLMLTAGVAALDGNIYSTVISFSNDGNLWTEQIEVGDDFMWIWKNTWFESNAYGVGYPAGYSNLGPFHIIRLYKGIYNTEISFSSYLDTLFYNDSYPEIQSPTESKLLFLSDSSAICLSRRGNFGSLLGYAEFPYLSWSWHDTEYTTRLGGPNMVELPTGHIVIAARLYHGYQRTSLLWLDKESNSLVEFIELPSEQDTGYPGLLFKDGNLYVSYYSSHEIGTNIYFAIINFPEIIEDCNGDWGGAAILDECGVCGGNGLPPDCCNCGELSSGGNCSIFDECSVCGGDNSTCTGCMNDTACNYDLDATIECDNCCEYPSDPTDPDSCEYWIGDITQDYAIDILDIISLLNFILEYDSPSDEQFYLANLVEDDTLNIFDIIALLNIILS